MSNTVSNTLIITGKERDEIRRFIVVDDGDEFFAFNNIIDVPQDMNIEDALERIDKLVDDRIAAWGTKTTGRITGIQDHKGKLIISFETAWSPPAGIVRKLIETHPYLRFVLYYEDLLAGFRGQIEGGGGEVTRETYREGEKAF